MRVGAGEPRDGRPGDKGTEFRIMLRPTLPPGTTFGPGSICPGCKVGRLALAHGGYEVRILPTIGGQTLVRAPKPSKLVCRGCGRDLADVLNGPARP